MQEDDHEIAGEAAARLALPTGGATKGGTLPPVPRN
jgi:hypothetical protein